MTGTNETTRLHSKLRDQITKRLTEAWPYLADDPVHADQLAAVAMTVLEDDRTAAEKHAELAERDRDEMQARLDSAYEDCVHAAQVRGGIERADAVTLVARIMSTLKGDATPSRVAYDRLHTLKRQAKAETEDWRQAANGWEERAERVAAERDEANATVERMRAALEEIKLRTVQRDLSRLAAAALQPPTGASG